MTPSSNQLLAEIAAELRRANDQREAFYREVVNVLTDAKSQGTAEPGEVPGD